MKNNSRRRMMLRLATLCVLVASVIFLASDRPSHASDYWACDSPFDSCNATCNPSNAVPCFGDCQYSYFTCLYNAGEHYSRTPLVDPSASCWDNAVSIYNHCTSGMMPLGAGYGDTYANCMAASNDLAECCGQVQSEWWAINGPWCY
jgi:hypothetical protein